MQNTTPVSLTEPPKDVDWEFERREEARLDAMYDSRYEDDNCDE